MSFFGSAVKRLRGGYAQRHQSLEKFGVFAYNDEAVTNRVVTLGELLTTFWNQKIEERVRTLDAIIDTIAGPWGEGGDTQRYFQAYGSWKLLLGRFHARNRQLNISPEEKNGHDPEPEGGTAIEIKAKKSLEEGREEFQNMAQISAEKHLIPYGWMIVEAAWKSKHINAATPIVIQSTSSFAISKEVPVVGIVGFVLIYFYMNPSAGAALQTYMMAYTPHIVVILVIALLMIFFVRRGKR